MSFLRLPHLLSCICGIYFAAVVLFPADFMGAEENPTFYMYQGSPKRLSLDPDSVAVFTRPGGGNQGLSAGLRASGILENEVQERLGSGCAIVKVDEVMDRLRMVRRGVDATDVGELMASIRAKGGQAVEFVSPVFRDARGGVQIVTPRILIGFEADLPANERGRLRSAVAEGAQLDAVPFSRAGHEQWTIQSGDGFDVLARANELAKTPGVAYAEPDMLVTGQSSLVPTDPLFSQSWGLRNTGQSGGLSGFDMGATAAWDITLGSSSVIVLVLDSGVQQNHPDINQVAGIDTTTDSAANPNGAPFGPNDNHGTAVAGCISSSINNALGTAGVAPGVRVASARCYNNYTAGGNFSFQFSWVVNALNWGQSIGARVSNNSNYYGTNSSAIESAYASTRTAGMVHFASAGNDGTNSIGYPSSIAGVNSVASANRFGSRSSFSQYGTGLDFTAPGESILTSDRTGTEGYGSGDYATVNGTSFSSPYAAGVAALVLSNSPALTVAQVESRMRNACTEMGPAGYDTDHGYGLVHASRSLVSLPQTITFNAIADQIATNTLTLSATGGASGNPVTFAVTSGPAVIGSGNLLSFTGAGTVIITASQAGNGTYADAPDVSRSFVVSKATGTVTLVPSSLSQTYNGTARSATATTSPGSLPVTFTYDGSSTAPTNAGNYAVVGSINHPIYQGSASGTLVVAKAAATVTFEPVTLSQTYNGASRVVVVTTNPASRPVVITYNGSTTPPVNAGSYPLVATINDPNYAGTNTGTLTVAKAVGVVTLSNLSQVYTGGPRPATVATNPTGLSYDMTYNGIASAPFNAGTYAVSVVLNSPNHAGSATGNLVVDKAAQVIDFTLSPGATATQTINLSATGGGSGNPVTYSILEGPAQVSGGNQLTFTGAGLVRIRASQTGGGNHFDAVPVERSITITKTPATLTLSNLSQIYDGNAKSAGFVTDPPGLSVAATYDGSTTSPIQAASYAVAASVNDPRYEGSATGTLVIEKAPSTVTLSGMNPIYTGAGLSATVSTNPAAPVIVTYGGSTTLPVLAGSYAVVATVDHPSLEGTASGTLVIGKAPQVINFPAIPGQFATDTVLLSAVGGGSVHPVQFRVAEGPGTISGGNLLTFSGAGDVSIEATQAGDSNHHPATPVTRSFAVTRFPASITLTNLNQNYDGSPRPITVATSPGGLAYTLTYDGQAQAPVEPGTYFVLAIVDEEFYEGDSGGFLVVAKGVQTIDFPPIPDQLANGSVTLSATGGPSGNPVTFEIAGGPGQINGTQLTFTGSGAVTVRARQLGNTRYSDAAPVLRTVTVNKAPATLTLGDLAQTYDGLPKAPSSTTDPVGLAVSYTFDGSPTVPTGAGTYAVIGTISDARYAGTATDSLVVGKASQTINFVQPPNPLATETVNLTATGGGSGNPVTFAVTAGPGSISGGNILTFTGAGQVEVTASQAANSNYLPAASVSRTLTVSKATVTSILLTDLHRVFDGTPREVEVITVPPGLGVVVTYDGEGEAPVGTGSYAVVAAIDDPRYEGSANGTLVVEDPSSLNLVPGGSLPALSDLGLLEVPTFSMGRYEVTWGIWRQVRDWAVLNGYGDLAGTGAGCADDHPVRGVNWFDAVKWCNARTEWENATLGSALAPAYRLGASVYRTGQPASAGDIVCDPETSGYRLPGAEEREFAARGGLLGTGFVYPGGASPGAVAWYSANSDGAACNLSGGRGTRAVGGRAANELGLHDLSGNLGEWTGDADPASSGNRLAPGGDWNSPEVSLLSQALAGAAPELRSDQLGFRLARSVAAAMSGALDNAELSWNSGGSSPWFAETAEHSDGSDGASSGALGGTEENWVETHATGPGNVSFRWKIAVPAGTGSLSVLVGEEQREIILGTTAWLEESVYVPVGTHRVRWVFRRLAPGGPAPDPVPGANGSWLDTVAFTAAIEPGVVTGEITSITGEDAAGSGEVTDDGGAPVTARGVVLSIDPAPTLGDDTDYPATGAGLGVFGVPLETLAPGTTYRVRAYAINAAGTGYGEEVHFTTDETVPLTNGMATRDREILSGDRQVFHFTLSSPRHASLFTTGGAALRAELFDSSGALVASFSGDGNFNLEELLLAGDYELHVFRGNDGGAPQAFTLNFDADTLAESLPDVAVGASILAQVGRDVRNATAGQLVGLTSSKAAAVSSLATVVNAGTLPDELLVSGTPGNALFAVTYTAASGNVTAQMIAGTYRTPEMVSGDEAVSIRAIVSPNKKKLTKKKGKRSIILKKVQMLRIRAGSTFDPSMEDAAYIQVQTQ